MQHLTDEDIAVCAEALEKDDYNSLPEEMRVHLSVCDQCAEEVLAVSEVASDFRFETPEGLPLWNRTQKIIVLSVSVAAAVVFFLLVFDGGELITEDELRNELALNESEKPGDMLWTDAEMPETRSGREVSGWEEHPLEELPAKSSGNFPEKEGAGEPENTNSTAPAEKQVSEESELLASYQPDEDLEKLVARSQSELRSGEEINVQTPVNLFVEQAPLFLEWTNKEKEELIIEILDNKGDRILREVTTGNRYRVENLGDGLYYWKLISSDYDLLFCGRIRVGDE
ncbi:MAG: hypothetical protein ACOCZI_00060 [Marinilabiliaceae bacterium]